MSREKAVRETQTRLEPVLARLRAETATEDLGPTGLFDEGFAYHLAQAIGEERSGGAPFRDAVAKVCSLSPKDLMATASMGYAIATDALDQSIFNDPMAVRALPHSGGAPFLGGAPSQTCAPFFLGTDHNTRGR